MLEAICGTSPAEVAAIALWHKLSATRCSRTVRVMSVALHFLNVIVGEL